MMALCLPPRALFRPATAVACFLTATPLGQLAPSQMDPRVLVNRHELRISIPVDTTWRDDRLENAAHTWRFAVRGMTENYAVVMTITQGERGVRPLESLAARLPHAYMVLCWGNGMLPEHCTDSNLVVTMHADSIVLRLQDSVKIAAMFGLRPATGFFKREVPSDSTMSYTKDSVPITYVAPQIPEPDSALIANAALIRRQEIERKTRVSRYIESRVHGNTQTGELRLAVGDTAYLTVKEARCREDVCGVAEMYGSEKTWTVGDSTVIHLAPIVWMIDSTRGIGMNAPTMRVIAKRIGQTNVRVDGIRSALDTVSFLKDRLLARMLERRVVVVER